ncbi:MAG: RHS repeat-associated core domain-containing protein [Pirellulaceae bacterium]|nr:RHS repeat-associated core domain-containing protein [Pirellulaceae bacterium]
MTVWTRAVDHAGGSRLTAVSVRYVNTVTYTYDSAGRKKTEGLTISGQTYTTTMAYNGKGELTGYTYPDGTAVGRTYTARGELYQLTHAGTTIDTRVYDNGGRMTSSNSLSNTHRFRPTGRFSRSNQLLRTVENNGVSETRAYNTDNTLASISFTGASIGNLTYGWDANKNKTSEAIAGTMSNYGFTVPANGYDSEDRLVGFNRTSGLTQSWNLSPVGDWNSVTTNGTAQARTHGPTHELLTAGGQNVSTDAKGNITLIPSGLRPNASSLSSVWDFDNRLNTADVGNNGSIDVTYKFDALGRRVFRDDGTTATIYVQAGQQTIADYTAGTAAASPTHRYVYASYIDEPVLRFKPSGSETLYYHRNQQCSVVALTNATAAIIERYAYTAYGVPTITNDAGTVLPIGSVNNRYMYTGREWDSVIAQYYYRARMYDPSLGRFASRDPISNYVSAIKYVLAAGNPIKRLDPSGMIMINAEIKAFISSRHDPDGDGWIPAEPSGISRHYFGTDKRLGGQPGTSRVAKMMAIDSCDIGRSAPFSFPPYSDPTRWGELNSRTL